jgi:hypothetical protein
LFFFRSKIQGGKTSKYQITPPVFVEAYTRTACEVSTQCSLL